jgi:hypothetical protein
MGMQMQQIVQSLIPPVHERDNDELHLAEHGAVTAAPATRRNAFAMAIANGHNSLHDQNIIAKAVKQAQMQVTVQAQTKMAAAQAGILPQPVQEDPNAGKAES